jgi:hypothetical protein
MTPNPPFKGEELMIPVANHARARSKAKPTPKVIFWAMLKAVLNRSALALTLGLAACTTVPFLGDLGLVETKVTTEHTRGNLDRVWAEPPGAMIMLQRNGTNDYEQLVGLENRTTLKGDNFLWLNANDGIGGQVSKGLDLKRLIARFGDVPAPFSRVDNNSLASSSDGLGTYFWQEYRAGPNTVCVFAMRRLGTGARAMPAGTRVLDLVLRNCVNGTASDALAPILDNRVSGNNLYDTTFPATQTRTLSRLAGPRP